MKDADYLFCVPDDTNYHEGKAFGAWIYILDSVSKTDHATGHRGILSFVIEYS